MPAQSKKSVAGSPASRMRGVDQVEHGRSSRPPRRRPHAPGADGTPADSSPMRRAEHRRRRAARRAATNRPENRTTRSSSARWRASASAGGRIVEGAVVVDEEHASRSRRPARRCRRSSGPSCRHEVERDHRRSDAGASGALVARDRRSGRRQPWLPARAALGVPRAGGRGTRSIHGMSGPADATVGVDQAPSRRSPACRARSCAASNDARDQRAGRCPGRAPRRGGTRRSRPGSGGRPAASFERGLKTATAPPSSVTLSTYDVCPMLFAT